MSKKKNRYLDVKEDLKVFDKDFKIYLIASFCILIFNIYLIFQFIYRFYINSDYSLPIFFICVFFLGLFLYLFFKAISIYESNRIKKYGETPRKIRFKFIHKMMALLEDFPYENRFKGRRKSIIKYLGWGVLIYFFIVGGVIRNVLEIQLPLNLGVHVYAIGYYIFVFGIGCILMYIFTKWNISKIIKVLLIGIPVMIQIPILVDYLMLGFGEPLSYAPTILWSDFITSFLSFFLDPRILSYATHYGHPTMFFFLMILNGMYIFSRNYYIFNNNKSRSEMSIIVLKTVLGSIFFYLFLQISAAIYDIIYITLDFFFLNRIYVVYILVYINVLYFSPFLVVWLKIHINETKKAKEKLFLLKNTPASNFTYLTEYVEWLNNLDRKYKSKYPLKLNILILSYLIFQVFLILILVPGGFT